jgi:hypothetical protein
MLTDYLFDDLHAQVMAMLDGRNYTPLAPTYFGWCAWFQAAAEGAWQ